MMKHSSTALYRYLSEAGVLHDTPEAIAQAKRAYRAAYKKQWRGKQNDKKELRILFTIEQYGAVKATAHSGGMRITPYARRVILTCAAGRTVVGQEPLLAILQLVGMAAIAATDLPQAARIQSLLEQAEALLLAYLKT